MFLYSYFLIVPFSPLIEKERKGPSTTEQQHHSLAELKGAQYAAIFFIQRYHLAGIGMKTGPGPETLLGLSRMMCQMSLAAGSRGLGVFS